MALTTPSTRERDTNTERRVGTTDRGLDRALDALVEAGRERGPVVTWARRPRPLLPGVTVALSTAALVCYLVVALTRIGSPAGLEWMEGGISLHVQRVLDGHSVYGPPSVGFTPYLYTPLFYYVGAAFRWVLGGGLWPLRLVSLLSSLALFAAVARLAWIETRSRWAAFGAAGVLAAAYGAGGSWLDVARVDTLCLALVFWALVVVRTARHHRAAVLAGLLAAAAVMTKQVALLPALGAIPFLWRGGRRLAWTYALAMVGAIGAAAAVLQVTSGGWFLFYAVDLPLHHHLVPREIVGFWTSDLGARLWPIALGAVCLALVVRRRGRMNRSLSPSQWFLLPVGAGLVAAAYFARLHSGGFANVLLPAYAAAAIAAAVVLHPVDVRGRRQTNASASRWWRIGGVVAITALFAGLAYDPVALVPSAAAGRTARSLPAELAALPAPVYLPGHPEYLAAAGLPTVAQTAAVVDVIRAGIGSTGTQLTGQLEALIRQRAFGSLVVDSNADLTVLPHDVCRYYAPVGTLSGWWNLTPVTGTATAPKTVWLARATPLASTPKGCKLGSPSAGGSSEAASG